ncbi:MULTISPECIES: DsbE family thiol:disulfide interchange protein [Sphingomonas]|uniref:DsbE family thiol:disulfide interchange protein n=1 Tax=Sphingomonas TaxID=13687 RepID=UPI0008322EAC|nr:DsbE family thiol:disulfide interchange protein [Sphingomonas sp. CCH10-B3]
MKLWLPLIGFLLLVAVAIWGLARPADKTIRSAMVGRPLPAFKLDPIIPGKPGVASATFTDGKPRLLNVFASWCVPCAAEAPQLAKLKAAGARIEAVAIRDKAADVQDFLARYGDPFAAVGSDPESEVQLAIGSSGVPETFVVDGKGQIVLQHIGDIRDEDVPGILAALEKAK